jgi:hypothetical protein
MPVFEIEANGRTYEVDAPDEAAATAALGSLRSEKPTVAADTVKAAGTGIMKGVIGLAGLPGGIRSAMEAGGEWVGDKLGLKPLTGDQKTKLRGALPLPTSTDITEAVKPVTGEFYKPETTVGKYAETVGEFVPAALAGPGGLARRLLTQAAVPGAASEAAGQATEGTRYEPWARLGGAVAGAVAPSAAARLVTPMPIDPTRRAMVDYLHGEGVNLTAGQATGSKALRYGESALGDAPGAGGRATAAYDRQGEQFTAAALRRVGEDAPRATPEVVDRAFTRIGQQFDDLAARNTARADQQFVTDLQADLHNYRNVVSPPNRAPAVDNYATEISNALQASGGALPGEVYQSLRSRMEATARGMGNPEARNALRDMRESLDDLMERNIATANPADIGAWREARQQYRNLLVVERAATGAGENAALGLVSPAALRQATLGVQGRRNYARGNGDFADLARSGTATMLPMPQSGTGPRALAQGLPAALGATIGATLGGASGAGAGALAGAATSAASPALLGRLLMSRPMQGYLSNQVAAPAINGLNPQANALIQLLMAEPRGQLQLQGRQ